MVGRSRERVARAKAKLHCGWAYGRSPADTQGNGPLADIGGDLPLALVPVGAQGRLFAAVADSLPDNPAWLTRRRMLQGSLLAAAAGLAGILPRDRAPEVVKPQMPPPFESAIVETPEKQVAMAPLPKRKPAVPASFVDRKLALLNENTGEKAVVTYWSEGDYVLEELERIQWLMRDHHVDEMHAIDLKLLELLHALETKLEIKKPLHILSAYRTPQTNAKLAERYDGVALHSYHMQGRAVDLYVPGLRKRDIFKAARALRAGGVGSYATYLHLDTGPVRTW